MQDGQFYHGNEALELNNLFTLIPGFKSNFI